MKFVTFLLVYFFSMVAQSQVESMTWGPQYKISKIIQDPFILGKVDSRYFVLRYYYKKIYLEAYDETTLIKQNSALFKPKFDGRDLALLSAFMFNDKPSFLLAGLNKEGNQFHYYLQSFDPDNLLESQIVKIGSRNYSGSTASVILKHPDFRVVFAQDLIFFVNKAQNELVLGLNRMEIGYYSSAMDVTRQSYDIIRVDTSLKVASKDVFQWPVANFLRTRTIVTQSNELVFTGYEYKINFTDNTEEVVRGKDYIIKYNLETSKIDSAEIFLGSAKSKSYVLYESDSGSVCLVGEMSPKLGKVNGAYTMKFDSDLELKQSSVIEFEKDFVTENKSKEVKKDNDERSSYNYYIMDLLVTDDKGTLLILEQFGSKSNTFTSNGTSSTTTSYTYGDILVLKHNSQGEFLWKAAVRKNQFSVNDMGRYSSFFAFVEGNDLHLIFNEEKKDMIDAYTQPVNEIPGRGFFGNMVTIDPFGEMQKTKLFEFSEDESMKMIPKSCHKINANTIFFYARNNSISMMGKLEI